MKRIALSATLAATLAWAQLTVDTVAGGAIPSGIPSAGVLTGSIYGITRDAAGNTYLCDGQLGLIWRIRQDGIIETFAGTGVAGFSGDGGPAVDAQLQSPGRCTIDARGNLFFADGGRIRRIDPSGTITTVAGTGITTQGLLGSADSAINAPLGLVLGLAVDRSGNFRGRDR